MNNLYGYLWDYFPQAYILTWYLETEKEPKNWENQFEGIFGVDKFAINVKNYPCDQEILIVYDIYTDAKRYVFQKETSFLLNNIFIDKWTRFETLKVMNYGGKQTIYLENVINKEVLEFFIREDTWFSELLGQLCDVLVYMQELHFSNLNIVVFVSKFQKSYVYPECQGAIDYIKKSTNKMSFILLSTNVNKSDLLELFPRAKFLLWIIDDIDVDDPEGWEQFFWSEGFGCEGRSPLLPPLTTSTVKPPSTKQLTTKTRQLTTTTSSFSTKLPTRAQAPKITSTSLPAITTSENKSSGNPHLIYLGIFLPLILIILCGFIVFFCWYKKKKRQHELSLLESNKANVAKNAYDREPDDPWEIKIDYLQINFMDKLGSGAFGDVFLGRLIGDAPILKIYNDSPLLKKFKDCEVAVKTVPAMQADDFARNEFQKEIEFMKDLKFHAHLVCMLGYVADYSNPLLLLEYCANGDLLHYIKMNKHKFIESFESEENTDCKTLISFAWQISSGLEYLSSLELIHRDIAARNILLDRSTNCKVSDFGLCRTGDDDQIYTSKGGKLPVRWMAIESLKEYVYTQKTDVWSYGVLLYELFTLGNLPYGAHIENILAYLEDGKRLEKPAYCSDSIYELMSSCWMIDPEERPTFTDICQNLTKVIEKATLHYNYIDTAEEIDQIDELDNDDN